MAEDFELKKLNQNFFFSGKISSFSKLEYTSWTLESSQNIQEVIAMIRTVLFSFNNNIKFLSIVKSKEQD